MILKIGKMDRWFLLQALYASILPLTIFMIELLLTPPTRILIKILGMYIAVIRYISKNRIVSSKSAWNLKLRSKVL